MENHRKQLTASSAIAVAATAVAAMFAAAFIAAALAASIASCYPNWRGFLCWAALVICTFIYYIYIQPTSTQSLKKAGQAIKTWFSASFCEKKWFI